MRNIVIFVAMNIVMSFALNEYKMDEKSIYLTLNTINTLKITHESLINEAERILEQITILQASLKDPGSLQKLIRDEFARSNNLIKCVRLYRNITGETLKESKKTVEDMLQRYFIIK